MTGKLQVQLVEAALAGNIDSFGELCAYYYPSMVAVAYSVLIDHQLAEDAAQEAFARALTNLRTLISPKKFASWLAQICRNVAVDMVRKRAARANGENLVRLTDSHTNCPDSQAVRDAIAGLNPADRELITLRYYNSLSYKQISAVLGISKATINGRLTRAKRKLADQLRRRKILES